jgi:hypothetical protein
MARIAVVLHANWFTNAEFDKIVDAGRSLNADDIIKYRCAEFPEKYVQGYVDHIFTNYKNKIPGLKIAIDVAYSDVVVKNAAKFKQMGFDIVDYNIEADFDGPNSRDQASSTVEKTRKVSEATRAQGLIFRLSPGRPNTKTWIRMGLLDDVARLVDQYHIQTQSVQDVSNQEYAGFTEDVCKRLRAVNPNLMVTSQVAPAQGSQPGKTVQQTMRDVITASMNRPTPGNTNGVSMWTRSSDVDTAKSFYTWFKNTDRIKASSNLLSHSSRQQVFGFAQKAD